MPHALITGGSLGLGRALAFELAGLGWSLTIDARRAEQLESVAQALTGLTSVRAIQGDVGEPDHREQLAAAIAEAAKIVTESL